MIHLVLWEESQAILPVENGHQHRYLKPNPKSLTFGRTAAIFPGTSEPKVLDAVLFSKEMELKKIFNAVPFLVFEDAARSAVSGPTQSKAMNSDLQMADRAGGKTEVIDKVEKYVTQAA